MKFWLLHEIIAIINFTSEKLSTDVNGTVAPRHGELGKLC
jgi:hypothetical protein